MPGGWPRFPMYRRFGPFSARYAASAWSMSKRKSCRPWIISVGVESDESFEIDERDPVSAFTVAMLVLVTSDDFAASRSGSQRLSGTSEARSCTRPDFERPCGASAVARFVQVITGTIAL